MTWTRLSDTLNSDPRYLRLSDAAYRLHVSALVWCNQHLTDGLVPVLALRTLTLHPHPELIVAELVKVGLWAPLDLAEEESWQVDWSDQLEAEEVHHQRQRKAAKQKAYRDRKSRHDAGDHSMCDPSKCPAARKKPRPVTGNVPGNEAGNVVGRVTESRPVPSFTGTGTDAAAPHGARVDVDARREHRDAPARLTDEEIRAYDIRNATNAAKAREALNATRPAATPNGPPSDNQTDEPEGRPSGAAATEKTQDPEADSPLTARDQQRMAR